MCLLLSRKWYQFNVSAFRTRILDVKLTNRCVVDDDKHYVGLMCHVLTLAFSAMLTLRFFDLMTSALN